MTCTTRLREITPLVRPEAPGKCVKTPGKGTGSGNKACAEAGLLQVMCKVGRRAAAKGARVRKIRGTRLMAQARKVTKEGSGGSSSRGSEAGRSGRALASSASFAFRAALDSQKRGPVPGRRGEESGRGFLGLPGEAPLSSLWCLALHGLGSLRRSLGTCQLGPPCRQGVDFFDVGNGRGGPALGA